MANVRAAGGDPTTLNNQIEQTVARKRQQRGRRIGGKGRVLVSSKYESILALAVSGNWSLAAEAITQCGACGQGGPCLMAFFCSRSQRARERGKDRTPFAFFRPCGGMLGPQAHDGRRQDIRPLAVPVKASGADLRLVTTRGTQEVDESGTGGTHEQVRGYDFTAGKNWVVGSGGSREFSKGKSTCRRRWKLKVQQG